MLRLLPDLKFPITPSQINPLMDSVMQLNTLDAGIDDKRQRGLGLLFHVHDVWVKSGGKIDYRGPSGHARLVQDSMTFLAGASVTTKIGDLPACHLAIDFSDTMVRLKECGLPLLSAEVPVLLNQCRDLSEYPPEQEKRIGLFLDMISKKKVF